MQAATFLEVAKDRVLERLRTGVRRIVIEAPAGAGKSSLLDLLGASLGARNRVVRLGLPQGDDAGMVTLVDAAAQLTTFGPELLERVTAAGKSPPLRWEGKLHEVRSALEKEAVAGDLVLLVDEPWFDRAATPQSELFVRQAIDITATLLGIERAIVVFAGTKIPPGLAETIKIELPSFHDARAALPEPQARGLAAIVTGRPVTPLAVRLLVALDAAGVDVGSIPPSDFRTDKLFVELGRIASRHDALRRTLARLAVLRTPFPRSLLEQAGYGDLDEHCRALVEALLSRAADGLLTLPEALSRQIRHQHATGDPLWLADEPAEAHRFAARHHREAFERARAAADVRVAVRHELEEIHQLTEAGDAGELLARSLWFVEQYDALGKALSQMALRSSQEGQRGVEERLRGEAIEAYERAIAHDERDAYAHHYIAYNLDILARDPARAEEEYTRARALDAEHAWYHSRYICFLVTRGRMTDAHASWEQAIEALGEIDKRAYKELHGRVARLLLHGSDLRFASEVLDDVPAQVRSASSWWNALAHLLQVLQESRDERLVFPPKLDIERRWSGPHLVPDPRNPHIAQWSPGCVVSLDRQLHLRVARRHESGREVISYRHLSRSQLRQMGPQAFPLIPPVGTFVEIIGYRDGTETLLT